MLNIGIEKKKKKNLVINHGFSGEIIAGERRNRYSQIVKWYKLKVDVSDTLRDFMPWRLC